MMATVLFLTNCQAPIDHQDISSQASKNSLTISFSTEPMTTSSVKTRTVFPATDEEKNISTMRLFFFEYSKSGNGKFVESYTVDPSLLGISTGEINIDFSSTSKLTKSAPYVVLTVANAPQALYNSSDNDFAGWTEEEFSLKHLYQVTPQNDGDSPLYTALPIESNNLVMSNRTIKEADQNKLDFQVSRLVGRIDINNLDKKYALMSASIWNAATSTPVWETLNQGAVAHSERFYGVMTDTASVRGKLYTLSNYVQKADNKDKVTTCVVVGLSPYKTDATGAYEVDAAGYRIPDAKDIRYYRINITNDEGMQYLKRNKIYNVNIMGVLTKGNNNEKDAMIQATLGLLIDTNYWSMDESGSAVSDNMGNVLGVGYSKVAFTPQGGSRLVHVFTIGQGEPRIKSQHLPAGIKANLVLDAGSANSHLLEITAEQADDERSGAIDLEFGKLTATVIVVQSGKFQPYIKITPDNQQIFASQANIEGAAITISSSGDWEATIIGEGFTFDHNQQSDQKHTTGKDGDQIHVHTYTANNDASVRRAYVSFSPKNDPTTVATLQLIQQGVGGITLTPDVKAITFDANGLLSPGTTNTFAVSIANGNWEIVTSGSHPNLFQIDKTTGSNGEQFTVTASNNPEDGEISFNLRVQQAGNPSVGRDLRVIQESHTLSFSSARIPDVSHAGGSSEKIMVSSTANWVASIENAQGAPFAKLSNNSGKSGETFHVIFDPNTSTGQPQVTVKVNVSGTKVEKTITIKQEILPLRTITILGQGGKTGSSTGGNELHGGGHSWWHDSEAVYKFLINPSFFGPKGTVKTKSAITVHYANDYESIKEFTSTDAIYWANRLSKDAEIWPGALWKKGQNFPLASNPDFPSLDRRFLIVPMAVNSDGNKVENMLNNAQAGYFEFAQESLSDYMPHKLTLAKEYSETNKTGQKLWDYLLKDGPFTAGRAAPLSVQTIEYRPPWGAHHGARGISEWPQTFVPLILNNSYKNDAKTYCALGIDPTTNIMVLNAQLFNRDYASSGGSKFTENDDEGLFLLNLLAYIVNAAQYGDAFTKQFR
jgi:hypothetical protein